MHTPERSPSRPNHHPSFLEEDHRAAMRPRSDWNVMLSLSKYARPPSVFSARQVVCTLPFRRSLIAAPRPDSGPLLERRPDRALPPIPQPWKIWARTMPIFLLVITASALGIFNYQKQSSSVVASTLYALRTSELGRKELGDEIYFRDRFPWIWGQMNQLHGRIDIQFGVKGTRGSGMLRFRSERKQRMGFVSSDLICFWSRLFFFKQDLTYPAV